MFQNKCRDHGQDPADQKLDTGKLYTVCLRGKIVNHQNVQGKEKSTYQHQNISEANGKSVCDAEKIKSDQCHDNSCPDKGTAFLSYCCVLDAKLLEAAGSKKSKSAGNAAQPQVTAVIWRGGYSFF